MLENRKGSSTTSHVEFVEYTGKWPNLCGGILTLKIDGKIEKFGYEYKPKEPLHPKFWSSGGHCSLKSIEHGEWVIDVSMLPEPFREYAAEIDMLMNEHIDYGCCGGCR